MRIRVARFAKGPWTPMPPEAVRESRNANRESLSFRQPRRQSFSQRLQRLSHARFDRLDRDPEGGGDLAVLEAVDATQVEDLARAGREVVERGAEGGVDLLLDQPGVRGRRGLGDAGDVRLAALLDPGVAQVVERAVPRRAEEVGLEGVLYL